jgi:hypothetical protein
VVASATVTRRIVTTLALAMCLVGSQAGEAPEPTYRLASDVIHTRCGASVYIVGLIVVDTSGQLAIQDDEGVTTPLLWSVHGGDVPKVGHRYKIGGQYADWLGRTPRLWACAGADNVIPQ